MSTSLVVASPIDNDPIVVAEMLRGLSALRTDNLEVRYSFANLRGDPAIGKLLRDFSAAHKTDILPFRSSLTAASSDRPSHEADIWRMASAKDALLQHAAQTAAAYVLLVSSSLVMPPPTAVHLLSLRKDIVSEIFWSEWRQGAAPLPNVWLSDEYNFFPPALARSGADAQSLFAADFLRELREPGTYPVGGLSGCTMVSRQALDAGVCVRAVPNLGFWGEDRHFSTRAAALGLSLWVNTDYPLLNISRQEDVGKSVHFWSKWDRGQEAA